MVAYFFDSYALIEILNGNKNYLPYLRNDIILTKLNLMECYGSWIEEMEELKADHYFQIFNPLCIALLDEDIKEGVKLRRYLKREDKRFNPSYVDCISYVISLRLNIKFLTGDNLFENMKNVEFVK